MIRDFYNKQVLLITGSSGNIGRVFLEKVLFSLDTISHAYLIIRKGEYSSAYDRLHSEILQTQCFERIKQKQNFQEFIDSKLIAVDGNITEENIGIDPQTYEEIIQNVTLVFNIAASTKYTEPLNIAVSNNVTGPMNVLKLAQRCPNIKCLVHASTAYCMVHMSNQIEEEVYSTQIPPEQLYQDILNLRSKEEVKAYQQNITQIWPDTYTFSKFLTENLMKSKAGDLPIVLCRLPSVGASWKEPYPGWVDTSTATAAWILSVALGQTTNGQFNGSRGETIPCDICCNIMLVSPYFYSQKPVVTVLNVVSSNQDKVSFEFSWLMAAEYFKKYKNRIFQGPYKVHISRTESQFKRRQLINNWVPQLILNKLGNALGFQSFIEKAKFYQKKAYKENALRQSFLRITNIDRHYMTGNVLKMIKQMNPEDKLTFQCNILDVPTVDYSFLFCYGIQKWILKENDIDIPIDLSGHDLNLSFTLSHTRKQYKAYLNSKLVIIPFNINEIIDSVFEISKVNREILKISMMEDWDSFENPSEIRSIVTDMIQQMVQKQSTLNSKAQQFIFSQLRRRMFGKFIVDVNKLKKIKEYQQRHSGPIVLVTPYRSKLDFLVLKHVFYMLGLQQPFTTTFNYNLQFPSVLKGSLNLNIDQEPSNVKLYRALLEDVVQILLLKRQIIHIYIEDQKNKLGNINFTQNTLLKCCTEPFFDRKIKDITFLPISIVYDKVEKNYYMNQQLGNLHIHVGKKVFVSKIAKNLYQDSNIINQTLKLTLIDRIYQAQVITPIQLISTQILSEPLNLSLDQLQEFTTYLIKLLSQKNYKLGELEGCNIQKILQSNISLFSNIIDISKENSVEIIPNNKNSIKTLQFYSEQIQHAFMEESLICLILTVKGQKISEDELLDNYMKFNNVFKNLYQIHHSANDLNLFSNSLERLQQLEIVSSAKSMFNLNASKQFQINYFIRFVQNYIDQLCLTMNIIKIENVLEFNEKQAQNIISELIVYQSGQQLQFISKQRIKFILQFLKNQGLLEEYAKNDENFLRIPNQDDFRVFFNLMHQYSSPSCKIVVDNIPKSSF